MLTPLYIDQVLITMYILDMQNKYWSKPEHANQMMNKSFSICTHPFILKQHYNQSLIVIYTKCEEKGSNLQN
jgi:hypothetical protein